MSSRELHGKAVLQTRELDCLKQGEDAFADFFFRKAFGPWSNVQSEGDVLENGHVIEEGVTLEDKSGLPFVGVLHGHVLPIKKDLALVGKLESGNESE